MGQVEWHAFDQSDDVFEMEKAFYLQKESVIFHVYFGGQKPFCKLLVAVSTVNKYLLQICCQWLGGFCNWLRILKDFCYN